MNDFEDTRLETVVDWVEIAKDPIRREHMEPWLKREQDRAVENGLQAIPPGTEYWRGYYEALKMVREQPEREVAEAARAEREAAAATKRKDEDAKRTRFGTSRLRRIIDPSQWGRQPAADA